MATVNRSQGNDRGYPAIALFLLVLILGPISGSAAESAPVFVPLDAGSFQMVGSAEFSPLIADVHEEKKEAVPFKLPLISILGILLAALAASHERFRFTRHLFLLTSLGYFGFYNGGCPCIISGFQNLVLFGLGVDVKVANLVWFLAVLVTVYLFGRIWCGWICHLGALQEFIYKTNRLEFFKSPRTQKIMQAVRYALFFTLILQLLVTRENLFSHVDPFKTAFNLLSSSTASWVLLGLLIIASLFIYRPFCRSACPVGLLSGLIGKLPGALVIGKQDSCNNCGRCVSACNMQALNNGQECHKVECIACGDCMDRCKKGALTLGRRHIQPQIGARVPKIDLRPQPSSTLQFLGDYRK